MPTNATPQTDFLETYLAYTKEQESPQPFHLWTGLWTIGAALERRVWFDKNFYRVYPNLYIVLVAGSSFCRKSTAIEIGVGLLKRLKDRPLINADLTSPERFLQKIARATKVRLKGEAGEVMSSCAVTAPELSIFLGNKNTNHRMVSILSELYACPDEWAQDTIARGVDKLRNVCINMIGASTISWLKKSLSHKEMEGGFANRVIWICQEDTAKIKPFPVMTAGMRTEYQSMIRMLDKIRQIRGPFVLTPEARVWYENWYEVFRKKEVKDVPGFLDSYLGRRQDHLIKVGMLVAISRGAEVRLEITKADFIRADRILLDTEATMPVIFEEMLVHSEDGEIASRIWGIIYKHKAVDAKKLIQRLWRVTNAERIYRAIATL